MQNHDYDNDTGQKDDAVSVADDDFPFQEDDATDAIKEQNLGKCYFLDSWI